MADDAVLPLGICLAMKTITQPIFAECRANVELHPERLQKPDRGDNNFITLFLAGSILTI
jgi:hypothetical protein